MNCSSGFRLFAVSLFGLSVLQLGLSALVWPTPNPAFAQGRSIESFIQATVSKDPQSGLYGLVRNQGQRFHEGMDLFGLQFDEKDEALDPIYSVLPGRVAYINRSEGKSGYGCYIVLLHGSGGLMFYSLYAHLQSVDPRIQLGMELAEGAIIGRMGRTAGGYSIPKERAHLHFEIGLRYTQQFQYWYDRQSFPSENWHGVWNGLNLFGIDPLDFYRSVRSGKCVDFSDYLKSLPIVLRMHVSYAGLPDFLRDNPSFILDRELDHSSIAGWELSFARFGVPIKWRALKQSELDARAESIPVIIQAYPKIAERFLIEPALFEIDEGRFEPSRFLITKLEKLFIQRP